MQTIVASGLPGETIVTFGMRGSAGVCTLSATNLSEHELQTVYRQLIDLTKRCEGRMVLDASMIRPLHCTWINSLLDLHHWCRGMGGQLIIAGLPEDATDMLRSTGLMRHFTLAETREDAVRTLNSKGAKFGLLDRLLGRAA